MSKKPRLSPEDRMFDRLADALVPFWKGKSEEETRLFVEGLAVMAGVQGGAILADAEDRAMLAKHFFLGLHVGAHPEDKP